MGPKPGAAKGTKGKGGESTEVVGAKFAWIILGSVQKPLKVLINLNCNIEIIIDYARRNLLQKLNDEIHSMKTALDGNNSGDTEELKKTINEEEQIMIEKLIDIQGTLNSDSLVCDLFDPAGSPSNCPENVKCSALDASMAPGVVYSLVRRSPPDEKGNYSYNSFVIDISQRSKSPSRQKR